MGSSAHTFRIRVLTGPLKDCVYPSEDRIEIGRSDSADIQLAGRGVSRQHATVVANDQGFVLLDMLSTNGTWIEGERVSQRAMTHGDRFIIDDCEFEFELLHPSDPPSEVPGKPRIAQARLERETVDFDGPRISGQARPTPRAVPRVADDHSFVDGDAQDYPGNLLADIMLYRNLRLRVVQRGDKVRPDNLEKFKELDGALRATADEGEAADRREFARYSCSVPGTLRLEHHGDQRVDVVMLDVAVDGARVQAEGLPADPTGMVWLSLPSVGPDGLRCMVFTARAAWSKPGELGLVFSGAPSWATRNRDRLEEPTTPTPIAPVRLSKTSGE